MDWETFFIQEKEKSYYKELEAFLDQEYKTKTIYPSREELFTCFDLCQYEDVKVVILGQDPYHQPGQAHGLSFSVKKGVKIPPSLRNIYKELHSDLGIVQPDHGCLQDWAKQGVFLMNAVMSVEEGKAGSHRKKGWEFFIDEVMKLLNNHEQPLVFVLWGNWAKDKAKFITNTRHKVIMSAHPSPLSAYQGFFGSRPFSQINEFLKKEGLGEIDWRILS